MPVKNKAITILIIAIALFMESFDLSAVNNALPYMAKSLKTEPINLKIALTSYLFLESLFIPISGWLSKKIYLKKIFFYSLIIFTLSSFLCGLAKTINQIEGLRAIQGIGAAFCMPIGRLILARCFEGKNLLDAVNSVMGIALIGLIIGPFLGGIVTYFYSWRYIFFINIPIFFVEILLIKKFLFFEEDEKSNDEKFDIPGYILLGLFLTMFYLFFSLNLFYSINLLTSTIILAAGVLFLLFYKKWSVHSKSPIVPLTLFQNKIFTTGVIANFTFRLIFGCIPFVSMLILQTQFKINPIFSGLLLAAIALGMIIMKKVMRIFTRLLHIKLILTFNSIIISIFVLFICFSFYVHSYPALVISLFFYGFFASLHYSVMNIISYEGIPRNISAHANTVINTIRILGTNFGIAFSVLIIKFFLFVHLSFMNAYLLCMVSMGFIAFLNIPFFMRLHDIEK